MRSGGRRATRSLRSWFALSLVLAAALLGVQCSESPTGVGSGGVALDLHLPAHRGAEEESLSVWIEDGRGGLLSGPARIAWGPGGNDFDVSLDVPEGNGRRVWAALDAPGWRERGLIALGSRGNVRIRAAAVTDVTIELEDVVPRISPVVAEPGDLEYRVQWSSVPGAERYELLEIVGETATQYLTTETSRIFPLVSGETAFYRVRAQLSKGATVFTDSVRVDRGLLSDLPRIVAVDPAEGASEVLDTTIPKVTFDRPMDWSTLQPEQVRLVEEGSGKELAIVPAGAPGEADLSLLHAEPFVRGKTYRIEVDPGLRDFEGRPYDQEPEQAGLQGFTSRFTTETYAPLAVIGVSPADGAQAVPISAEILLTFNRAFDPQSIDASSLRLLDANGDPVACTRHLEEASVRLVPDQDLAYEGEYRVEVTTAVLDLRGEPLDQDPSTPIPIYEGFSSSFRAEVQPTGPQVSSVTPPNGELNAPASTTVEIELSRPVDPATVSSPATIAVRKLPIEANIAGTLTGDGSGQRFIFTPAAPLEAGTRYRVVVTTGVRDLEGIPLDQDPSTPGFQPFQSEFRVERTIQVTASVPANNAVRVPVEQVVQVQLSAPVDPTSVTETSFRLERGGVPVEAERTLSSDRRTALLTPNAPLARFAQYTVRVTPDLRSAEGGRLDQNPTQAGYQEFTSRFTTKPESLPPMVTAVLPENGASGVPVRPHIQVSFNKPVLPASVNAETFLLRNVASGQLVSGTRQVAPDSTSATFQPTFDLALSTEYEIEVTNWVVDRFDVRLDQDPVAPDRQGFKSRFQTDHERIPPRVIAVAPPDSAVRVRIDAVVRIDFDEAIAASTVSGIELRDQSGELVAGTVELGNGDARAEFRPDAPLRLSHRYHVKVDTTVTDRVGNPLDQNPATPPREPFTSLFWTVGDETGPRVVAVTPADGSEGVALDITIGIGFSEPIDPATASGAALLDSLGAPVSAQIQIIDPDSLAIVPDLPLEFDHRYAVSVAAVADSAGNPLDQDPSTEEYEPFLSHFRTHLETIRPRVTQVRYDAPEGEDPPVTTRIWIAFSEPIDPLSLDPGDVVLTGVAEVECEITFVASDTMRIAPVDPLRADTHHELTVSGLADLVGNPFDQDPKTEPLDPFETEFTTEPDTDPPYVIASIPAHGEQDVPLDQIVTVTFSEPMDSSTVTPLHLQLVRIDGSHEFPVSGAVVIGSDPSVYQFVPENPLLRGYFHEIRGDFFLKDLAGNPLDQDPNTPQDEPFVASFLVGSFPVADAGGPICDPADSSAVRVDGSSSFDPDGTIVSILWRWGDGTETEINSPAPEDFVQDHVYACSDIAGCDGVDNDGDGAIDDCDESYRIILRVRDNNGLTAADTIGVSFCGFVARQVEPMDQAADVDTLLSEVRITFSRAVADSSLDPAHFRLLEGELDTGLVSAVAHGESTKEVVLTLDGSLAPGTTYTISAETTVEDSVGRRLDQDLCAPGLQPFTSEFTTLTPE